MNFFKKLLVGLFPFFLKRYAEKNPKAREWADAVIAVVEAQYGVSGLTRDGFLKRFDAEVIRRGGTPELVTLCRYYAEQHLDKLGVK
jgi:hypothetical protein